MEKFKHPDVVIRKTGHGDEHRVNYRKGREETASYQSGYEDAVGTAKHMAHPDRVMKEHEHPYWNKK